MKCQRFEYVLFVAHIHFECYFVICFSATVCSALLAFLEGRYPDSVNMVLVNSKFVQGCICNRCFLIPINAVETLGYYLEIIQILAA